MYGYLQYRMYIIRRPLVGVGMVVKLLMYCECIISVNRGREKCGLVDCGTRAPPPWGSQKPLFLCGTTEGSPIWGSFTYCFLLFSFNDFCRIRYVKVPFMEVVEKVAFPYEILHFWTFSIISGTFT